MPQGQRLHLAGTQTIAAHAADHEMRERDARAIRRLHAMLREAPHDEALDLDVRVSAQVDAHRQRAFAIEDHATITATNEANRLLRRAGLRGCERFLIHAGH